MSFRTFIAQFARVTSGGRFIPMVDGLRFIAIGLVVLFHSAGLVATKSNVSPTSPAARIFADLCAHGHYGVHLFFGISGFILALPFATHHLQGGTRVKLRDYFLRRLTRLEPPYLLSLALCFVLLVAIKKQPAGELVSHLFASSGYLHNLLFGVPSTINGVAWSLEVEVQFYVLVPLLTQVFAIRPALLRRAIVVAAMAAVELFQLVWLEPHGPAGARLSILGFLQYFLAGFLVADLYVESPAEARPSFTWDLVGAAGWLALPFLWSSEALTRVAFAPLMVVIYWSVFRGRIASRAFAHPVITTIGGMCYTIYLLHFQVLSLVSRFSGRLVFEASFLATYAAQMLLFLPAILVISSAYFFFVEKPCMRRDWVQRAWARMRGRAVAQPAGGAAP
jgi:peptidoglycan/LPS O-acetylase OafA/YrhL